MNTEPTPEQVLEMLTAFCGAGTNGIYDIARPFMLSDHVYATDRRIIVRAPKDKCATPPSYDGPMPPVDALNWNSYNYVAGPEPLPLPTDLPEMKKRECPYCKGGGKWREIDCPDCYGEGSITDSQAVELSTGVLLNRVYLEKIIRFTPQVWPSDPIRFAFYCIEGLVMPMISSSHNIVPYKRDEAASRKVRL